MVHIHPTAHHARMMIRRFYFRSIAVNPEDVFGKGEEQTSLVA